MDVFFEETDWLCSHQRDRVLMAVKNTFFHQEIAGDGRVLQGDGLALLPWYLLCSPGRIAWGGDKSWTLSQQSF